MNPGEEYIYGHYIFEIKKNFFNVLLNKGTISVSPLLLKMCKDFSCLFEIQEIKP